MSRAKSRYVYYQPNKKDSDNTYGDCVIRSICKVTGKTWLETFDSLLALARKKQSMPENEETYAVYLARLGFEWIGIKTKKGEKRPTVATLHKLVPKGKCIASTPHHLVAVVDGYYYDTWDSGDKCVYGYFIKRY